MISRRKILFSLKSLTRGESRFGNLSKFLPKEILTYFGILTRSPVKVLDDKFLFEKFVKEATNREPLNSLDLYVEELLNNNEMKTHCQKVFRNYKNEREKNISWENMISTKSHLVVFYYALIREVKPFSILETGTASGSATKFLLLALQKNNYGSLTSIDLPPIEGKLTMGMTLSRENIGYWIPDSCKKFWNYIEGDAKEILNEKLISAKTDLFIHDSLHSASHMAFEYRVARNILKPDAIILSDDVLYWNDSFYDFCREHNLKGYSPISNPNFGMCINKYDKSEIEYSQLAKFNN